MGKARGVGPRQPMVLPAVAAGTKSNGDASPSPDASERRRDPDRRWIWWCLLALALLVGEGVALTADLGSRVTDRRLEDWFYYSLMVGSTLAVALRAVRRSEQRLAWSLVAVALGAWTVGDLCYSLILSGSGPVPYPSLADAGYLLLYVFALAGLRLLGARVRSNIAGGSWSLVTVILGVATLWSWLVYGVVAGDAAGDTAAVATALAYPLGDLLLLVAALLLVLSGGPRLDRPSAILAAGFGVMAIVDSVYAAQVASGTYEDGTVLTLFWPMAAVLVAVAAWTKPRRPRRAVVGERVVLGFTIAAMIVALAVQFVDHFARVDTLTFILSSLTLLTAGVQMLLLHRDRVRAVSTADAAERLRSNSIEAALDCVITIDAAGLVLEWNEAASRTFRHRREDALGRELSELIIPPAERESHREGVRRLTETGEARILDRRIEVVAMRDGGATFPAELAITRVQDDPPIFTGFVRDISGRRRRQEENERLAAIVRSSEDAILSKDLKGYVTAWNKGAEKLYGFTAEEAVGRKLATLIVPVDRIKELDETTRAVIAGGATSFDTRRRTKSGRVLDVSLNMFAIRDVDGELVGISTTARDLTERLRREEQARQDREGYLWRGRVRDALAKDEFSFLGQPVIDPRTGAVDHHELLLRMKLDGDTLAPGRFLPHVEDDDLMIEIDRWAVRTGVEYARRSPVAINLSARSLSSVELMEDIKGALDDPDLARNVTFEITETAAARNLEEARRLVEDLTGLGCGVALDDFGTGYGSFTYLKYLPVTELKIDIEFVRGLVASAGDQMVVKSIVSIARDFGMRTVAEGVENEETLDLLKSMGVDLVQGYLLGRPAEMPDPSAPRAASTAAARRPRSAPIDPQPGVQIVTRLFKAIAENSPAELLELVDPNLVWTPSAWSGARTFHGHEGLGEWMSQFGPDLAHLSIEPIEIQQRGDNVLVLGTVHDLRQDLEFSTRVSWVFRIEGGLILEGQAYLTFDEARHAAFS